MKINAYDVHELPQEAIDLLEDIRTLLNFGKYQRQIVTGVPGWNGRAGEEALVFSSGSGSLYVCTTDGRNTWKREYSFAL